MKPDILEHLKNRKAKRAESSFSFRIQIDGRPVRIYAKPATVADEAKIKTDPNIIEQMLNEVVFRSLNKDGTRIFDIYDKGQYRQIFDPGLLYEWHFQLKRPVNVDEKDWDDHTASMMESIGGLL